MICQGAANLTAAEHDWLLAVAEFDRREGWKLWECASCAAWLSWQVGLDIRAAREKVRVARALERLPLVDASMAEGHLSYSKVRAITRIATPESERALVDMALAGTTNHVERIVSAYRRAEPIEVEREQLQNDRRSLRHHIDDDGSVVITVRLPAEAGTLVLSAIEQLVAPSTPEPDGTRISLATRRADALVELALVPRDEAQETSSRYLVTLHVAEAALNGGDRGPGGLVEEDQRWPGDQAGGQVETAPHASGERRDRLAGRVGEVELLEQARRGLAGRRFPTPCRRAKSRRFSVAVRFSSTDAYSPVTPPAGGRRAAHGVRRGRRSRRDHRRSAAGSRASSASWSCRRRWAPERRRPGPGGPRGRRGPRLFVSPKVVTRPSARTAGVVSFMSSSLTAVGFSAVSPLRPVQTRVPPSAARRRVSR